MSITGADKATAIVRTFLAEHFTWLPIPTVKEDPDWNTTRYHATATEIFIPHYTDAWNEGDPKIIVHECGHVVAFNSEHPLERFLVAMGADPALIGNKLINEVFAEHFAHAYVDGYDGHNYPQLVGLVPFDAAKMRAFCQSLRPAVPAGGQVAPVVDSPPAGLVVPTTVVDYFAPHGHTFMECIRGEGVSGIARYLTNSPTDARQVTASEISDAHQAGHAVHFFYEMNPTYPAYFTYAQGAEDCRQAIERLSELGAPAGTFVYFAVDTNIEPSIADEYFNGVESMATPQITPGVYGYERMIEHARASYPNVGKHLAQTYGTPRGPLDLWQREQRAMCGVAVDINECTVTGWRPKEEDVLTEERIREWAKEECRVVLAKEYGPALEAELTQRLTDNSAGDVGAAVAAAVKAVGEKLTA